MARHEDVSVGLYEKALNENPASLVFSRLADCYRKQGEIQQAIDVCQTGIASHPEYVTGRVILGRCYLEQEKLKEAVTEFVQVVNLDRHNHVALKMIADVYSRQGLKEKAGDLYAYLLRMDPENSTLSRLVSAHRGTGEINVLNILGIAAQSSAPRKNADLIVDVDRTIQMDIPAKQADIFKSKMGDPDDIFLRTQKFDAEELSAAAGQSYAAPQKEDATSVTGDDISDRMSSMFEDLGSAPEVAPQPLTEDIPVRAAPESSSMTGDDVSDRMSSMFEGFDSVSAPEPQPAAEEIQPLQTSQDSGMVTGDDVDNRMSKMFSQFSSAPVEPADPLNDLVANVTERDATTISGEGNDDYMSSMFEQLNDADPSSIRDAIEMSQPDVDSAEQEYTNEKLKDDTVVADLDELKDAGVPSAVSGTDITSRLDSMFGEPEQSSVNTSDMVSDFTQPYDPNAMRKNAFESPAPEDISVAATQEYKLDEMTTSGDVSGSDVTARLNEMFAEESSAQEPLADMGSIFGDQENDLPVADSPIIDATEQLTKKSVSLPPDMSPEIDIADTNIGRDQTRISGDDVALRLDTIFDNEESSGDMQQSSFDTPVADDVAAYEETRSPVEQDAAPDVDNVEKYSASIDDESDTMMQNETGILPVHTQEEDARDEIDSVEKQSPVPAIDDTLSVESSPEMSGDDVAARLDKLFAKSFESTDDVSSIPEEDHKADDIGQGFYTMSGDNAETATSEDSMLLELDRTESDVRLFDPDNAEEMPAMTQTDTVSKPPIPDDLDEVVDKTDDRDATIPIHSAEEPVDESEYAIPDHVLTPTLADIYYQQGQFTLALRMYQRLLESDPDNERLCGRVREIERAIDMQINSPDGAQMPDLDESDMPKRKTSMIGIPEKSQSAKPLAGVRIKKKYKNRIRKSGRKKRGA